MIVCVDGLRLMQNGRSRWALPWGATESHGHHLPYATDHYEVEAMCAEAGRLAWEANARVAVLPGIPFGVQTGDDVVRNPRDVAPVRLGDQPRARRGRTHELLFSRRACPPRVWERRRTSGEPAG